MTGRRPWPHVYGTLIWLKRPLYWLGLRPKAGSILHSPSLALVFGWYDAERADEIIGTLTSSATTFSGHPHHRGWSLSYTRKETQCLPNLGQHAALSTAKTTARTLTRTGGEKQCAAPSGRCSQPTVTQTKYCDW